MTNLPCLSDVFEARKRISGHAVRTPLIPSKLGQQKGGPSAVYLKLECFQPTGAFKLRGATNAVLSLPEEKRRLGLVTASSGNHGRAIAYLAQTLRLPAVICLSDLVNKTKIAPIEALGAELSLGGADQDAAIERAHGLSRDRGLTYVDPFDDFEVVCGQATIGLEILEDLPDVDVVLVQVSGGGLAAGVALAVKEIRPTSHVIGVSMTNGAAMHAALAAGGPVPIQEVETIADALQGGVGEDNRYTFRLCQTHLDDFVLLSEDEIAQSMKIAFEQDQLVLEGAGAVGFGALKKLWHTLDGARVALICSGRNVPTDRFLKIIEGRNGW